MIAIGSAAECCSASSPTSSRSRFGCPGVSRPPAPYPDAEIRIAGSDAYCTSSMRRIAAPVGVTRSIGGPAAYTGASPRSAKSCRRGHRQCSVRTVNCAAADVERRRQPAIDAEMRASDRRADNVDNRVDRADLVEVHLLDGHGMNLCLGLAQQLKRTACAAPLLNRQSARDQ